MCGGGHCTFQLYKLRAALKDGISFVCPLWFMQRPQIVLWLAFSQKTVSHRLRSWRTPVLKPSLMARPSGEAAAYRRCIAILRRQRGVPPVPLQLFMTEISRHQNATCMCQWFVMCEHLLCMLSVTTCCCCAIGVRVATPWGSIVGNPECRPLTPWRAIAKHEACPTRERHEGGKVAALLVGRRSTGCSGL
jgi:hypothetical protein